MSSDDTEKKGPGKPGGGKDLDELKAKLGLRKGPPKSPVAGSSRTSPSAPKKSVADDFKFSFGDSAGAAPGLSEKELASIDAEARKASKPMGRRLATLVFALILMVTVMWLGYQFGNSMGKRTLHNAAVEQSQGIKKFFMEKYADSSGLEVDPRKDITTRFVDKFDEYHEAHISQLTGLSKMLIGGNMPAGFEMDKFRKEELAEMKEMCMNYMRVIEEYSVGTILKGNLYSTELGAKLLEFVDRSNKLRNRVENLYFTIELVETYMLSGEMPSGLKPEIILHGFKPEKEKESLLPIDVIEIAKDAKAELDKELKTSELCEPVSMELEIPICGARKGEPETEKRLIDTFDKKEVQEVIQFRTIKIKNPEGKTITARIEHLFKMDLRPYLMPLIERIGGDKKVENENLGYLVQAVVQNMNDVRMASEAVDFTEVLDAVNKYASQEMFFTF